MKRFFGFALAAILTAGAYTLAAQAQHPFHVTNKWVIGGDDRWDFLTVDSVAHRLYIARGTRIQVLDLVTGKLAGEMTGFKGTHGVVLDGDNQFGYITDGGSNTVKVFDPKTLKVVASIDAGTNPDCAVYEPATGRLFVFNGRSKDATVIDTKTRTVVATIPLRGKPEFPVVDGQGIVWVNIENTNEVQRIDAATAKVTATWSLAPCESPSGHSIDVANRRLFAVCDNKQAVITDADKGTVVASVAIGGSPDAAIFDAKSKLLFSSNEDGTLSIINQKDPNTYALLQTLKTQQGARTIAQDTATGKLYLVTANFGPTPAATGQNHHPHPTILPNSFVVLEVAR